MPNVTLSAGSVRLLQTGILECVTNATSGSSLNTFVRSSILNVSDDALNYVEEWKKTKIADGYKPMGLPFPGKGAPGRASSFKIHVNDTKKAILVSGDDGGVVDLLVLEDDLSCSHLYIGITNFR